ncbi:lipocalin family protein [Aquimarina sp. 2201CG1-2-11]|uniref:lipocalin family protein n=1 Tax=Aquimarina discodermiae TaxID=3231043 RepID=UPI003461B5D5
MKNVCLCLIAVVTILFASCNKDDDGGGDQILGTWKLITTSEKIDNSTKVVAVSDCEKKSTVDYKEDGTYKSLYYDTNAEDECVLADDTTGTWKNLGDGKYEFKFADITNTVTIEFTGTAFAIVETREEDGKTIISKTTYSKN